jgi:GNAT superfamily N-acetyltransferase
MEIAPLDGATALAWQALFEACGCTCFCRYWGYGGTKAEWLERSFTAPEKSRDEQLALVRQGAPEARGLLALERRGPTAALGWMKLGPRAHMPKLLRQGAYRPLDLGPAEGVWVVGCLLVHPGHRRSGIARAMVAAADDHVRSWGGTTIEAYPRSSGTDFRLHDEEAWMGTSALFAECGFERVAGEGAYPVMRKVLGQR